MDWTTIITALITGATGVGGAWWGGRISAKASLQVHKNSLLWSEKEIVVDLIRTTSILENTLKRDTKKGRDMIDQLLSNSIAAQCSASDSVGDLFEDYSKAYLPIAAISPLIDLARAHDCHISDKIEQRAKDEILRLSNIVSDKLNNRDFANRISERIGQAPIFSIVSAQLHETLGDMIRALQAINIAYDNGLTSLGEPKYTPVVTDKSSGMYTPPYPQDHTT